MMPEVTARTRRMRLLPKDYERHGYTTGCPGCIHLRRGGAGPSRNHSDECRARIEAEPAQTERGKARLGHVKERLDRSAAKVGEAVVAPDAAGAAEVRPEGEMRVPPI